MWILTLRHKDARAEPYDTLGKPALRRFLAGEPVPFQVASGLYFSGVEITWNLYGRRVYDLPMKCPAYPRGQRKGIQ
jgi:hypothetical protein